MIGHQAAQAWLRRALQTGHMAHAYLITGPRSVGKRTFALEVAQALSCLAPGVGDRPDHTCQQCRMIERGVHPDVRVVRRAPERRMISMRPQVLPGAPREYTDNVQFIQSDAHLRPVMGRMKVYLILYAEELAEDAGNRLLKTLEEPPPFVVPRSSAVACCPRSRLAVRRFGSGPRRGLSSRERSLRLEPSPSALNSLRRWLADARGGPCPHHKTQRCTNSSKRMPISWYRP